MTNEQQAHEFEEVTLAAARQRGCSRRGCGQPRSAAIHRLPGDTEAAPSVQCDRCKNWVPQDTVKVQAGVTFCAHCQKGFLDWVDEKAESYNWRMIAHCNSDFDEEGDPVSATPPIDAERAKANANWIAAVHNAMPALIATLTERDTEVVRRGRICVVQITGDPEDSNEIGSSEQAWSVIDGCLAEGVKRNDEANRLRAELQQKDAEVQQAKLELLGHASPQPLISAVRQVVTAQKLDAATAEKAMTRLQQANERIVELEVGLQDAIESLTDWGAYASDYFQKKHDLAGNLQRLNNVLKTQGASKT